MAYSLLEGHYCDPEYVVAGYCPDCGTTWNRNNSTLDLTIKGLRGVDIRDDNGRRFPLL